MTDAPTTKEEEAKVDNNTEEKTEDQTDDNAGRKRSASATDTEPPTKKAMTETSSSSTDDKGDASKSDKGQPPLIPMDLSAPDAKDESAATAAPSSEAPAPKLDASAAPVPGSAPAEPTAVPTISNNAESPKATAAPAKRRVSTSSAGATATNISAPSKPSGTSRGSGSKKSTKDDSKDNSATTTTAAGGNKMKGLRHFSLMVCKKVEEKGNTTYNEVADELVQKVIEDRKKEDPGGKFDEKNIRRRVYDSINVLLAMDIIAKDKKQISWQGLPCSTQHDLQLLEREEQFRKEQVQMKRRALQQILTQQICFHNLVTHNKEAESADVANRENHADVEKVPMPFAIVNSHKEAVIHCNMAPDLQDVMFEFDRPFEIHDDQAILRRMGMHKTSLSAVSDMVPKDMVAYCQEHGLLDTVLGIHSGGEKSDLALPAKGQYFMSLS